MPVIYNKSNFTLKTSFGEKNSAVIEFTCKCDDINLVKKINCCNWNSQYFHVICIYSKVAVFLIYSSLVKLSNFL